MFWSFPLELHLGPAALPGRQLCQTRQVPGVENRPQLPPESSGEFWSGMWMLVQQVLEWGYDLLGTWMRL